MLCEMHSVSSRIWTRVAVSNSYDDTLHHRHLLSLLCLYIYLIWFISIYLSIYLSSLLAISLSHFIHLSHSVHLSYSLFLSLSLFISLYLILFISIYLSIYLSLFIMFYPTFYMKTIETGYICCFAVVFRNRIFLLRLFLNSFYLATHEH